MSHSEDFSRGTFHETPLIGFTVLATAAGGVGTAHLLLALLALTPMVPSQGVMRLSALLFLAGLAFSAGHLGRPLRAPRALSRVGRSPLSNEVAVVGVALGATVLSALIPGESVLQPWAALAAQGAGFLTLLSLGLVYRLPGQLFWEGTAFLQPLVLGTAVGLLFHLSLGPPPGFTSETALAGLAVLADSVLVWGMFRRASRALSRGEPSHPSLWERRSLLLLVRGALGAPLPLLALLLGAPPPALVAMVLALILDRVLFYGLGIRRSTEAEVHRVEGVLRGRRRAGQ